MAEQWPPPEVKRLVEEKLKDENPAILSAEWPSPKDIDRKIRRLGRLLEWHEEAQGKKLIELYPLAIVSSRGGGPIANPLLRSFGYTNPTIRYFGQSSYENDGTEQGAEFLYGHMPDPEDLTGLDLLTFEEVVDTGRSQVNMEWWLYANGAGSITSAALDWKRGRSQVTGYVPDFHVYETENWIVYPWEIYELLGAQALDETIWLPPSARAQIRPGGI